MISDAIKEVKVSLKFLLMMLIITGILYPVFVTLIAQALFPHKANGSLIVLEDKVIGSELIGQNFNSIKYFWGRPSATPERPYNAMYSSGSNYGPSNPEFLKTVVDRKLNLQRSNPQAKINIPIDLITASASGLDPHISIRAAMYQIPRIAKARGLKFEKIESIILENKQGDFLFGLGPSYVNVLMLNLALDKL